MRNFSLCAFAMLSLTSASCAVATTDTTGEAAQASVVYRIDQAVIYCDPLTGPRPALYRGPTNPSGHDLILVEDDHDVQTVSAVPIAASVTITYDTATGAVTGASCSSSPAFLQVPQF